MSTILGSRNRRRYYPRSRRGARKPAGAGAVSLLARLGLVVRGVVYVVIGAIAIMLALGVARHSADTAGAIEAIAAKPFGYLLLWILVIGFFGLAVWQFVQAAVKRLNVTEGGRVSALLRGVAYAVLFFGTLMFVVHGREPAGSDASARDWTGRVLSHAGGPILVALVGVALIIAGAVLAIRGLSADFTARLRMGWMSGSTQNAVLWLGRAGYVARGAVVAGLGVAAVTYKASRAEGVFGILSFLEAKWRRTRGGVPV
jgi:hypothetical protein